MPYPLHQIWARKQTATLHFFVLMTIPLIAPAQQPASAEATAGQATIQALLVEVRELRIALERSASLLPRIQLAAQRLQAQQDRVDRLSRELRDFRTQIGVHSLDKDRLAGNLRQVESEVGQAQDQNRRKELEALMKALPVELQRHTAREQQERAQEIDLLGQIQSEQAKLNDLSDQLNALDKQLQPEAKSPPQR